jgi:hypothetical protein
LLLVALVGCGQQPPATEPAPDTAQAQPDPNLTNEDLGKDSKVEFNLPEIERIEDKLTQDNIGVPDSALPSTDTQGDGGKGFATFPGRSGATRARLVREGGGNVNGGKPEPTGYNAANAESYGVYARTSSARRARPRSRRSPRT